MNKTIDNCRRGHLVGKDLGPFFERQIGSECDAASLVALRDELKEQVGRLAFERDVPELVDEQQVDAIELTIVSFEHRCLFSSNEFHQQRGGRGEEHAISAHAHCKSEGAQDMALTNSRRTAEDHVALRFNEGSIEMLEELRLRQFWLKCKIEGLNRFDRREVSCGDPRSNAVFLTLGPLERIVSRGVVYE
jgi:hypothetical protein